jgi:uncharacterized repeat protein (TIGR01451 family)
MRPTNAILASFLIASTLLFGAAANAQDTTATTPAASQPLTGLWLTTDYPSLTVRAGDNINLSLTLQNKNLPPARVAFSVDGLPKGWTSEFDGGGKTVTAAIVQPDSSQSLSLKLTPPKGATGGSYNFAVSGKTDNQTLTLPIALTLSQAEPAKVTVTPKLPALRGSAKSAFDFDVDVKNEAQTAQTFNLLAKGPAGFDTTFKEQYGTQELTSVPLKAGESKTLKVSVKPPQNVQAGQYKVDIAAASPTTSGNSQLLLDITGEPTIALVGPEGRLSGNATAGQGRTFKFTVENNGSAPAKNVMLSSSPPQGWKVTYDPEKIPAIAPGDKVPVSVTMTPSDKAIAGDYMVTVSANGDGTYDHADFRVTVLTSTMWGIAGLGIIGAAVVVLAFAVTRYGRR